MCSDVEEWRHGDLEARYGRSDAKVWGCGFRELWRHAAGMAAYRHRGIEVWRSSGSMQACGRGGIEVWNVRGPAAGVATRRIGGMELWRLGALKACRTRVDAEAERYGAL